MSEDLQEHSADGGGNLSKAIIPFFAKKKHRVGVVEQGQGKKKIVQVFEDYIDTPSALDTPSMRQWRLTCVLHPTFSPVNKPVRPMG